MEYTVKVSLNNFRQVFRELHISMRKIFSGIALSAKWFRGFPQIHRHHHNNKGQICFKNFEKQLLLMIAPVCGYSLN